MKVNVLVIAACSALLAGPAFSQPIAGPIESTAVLQSGAGSRLVIGAAGTVQGVSQLFRTHLMLANFRNEQQSVRIDFLPQGNMPRQSETVLLNPSSFLPRTIPWSGLGSLLITAVNDEGSEDTGGRLSAIARIYSGDACNMGTVAQSFKAERVGTISGAESAYIVGLQQDRLFRTNIGVVNLHPEQEQTFTIRASGSGGLGTSEVTVPAMSMVQVPAPEACADGECGVEYFDMVVTVDPNGVPGDWFAYGSSVHNGSGDAWVSSALQLEVPQ